MPYAKIRYSAQKGITLTRVEDRANVDSIESTLTGHDLPRPEFLAALQALGAWVIELCELPPSYGEGLTVTGVSISLGEYGGCVVTALKQVGGAAAPVVINSPHVPAVATHDGGGCLPPRVVEMLEALEEEAERYWRGERAQADLFGGLQPAADSEIESVTLRVSGPGMETKSVTLPRRAAGGAA